MICVAICMGFMHFRLYLLSYALVLCTFYEMCCYMHRCYFFSIIFVVICMDFMHFRWYLLSYGCVLCTLDDMCWYMYTFYALSIIFVAILCIGFRHFRWYLLVYALVWCTFDNICCYMHRFIPFGRYLLLYAKVFSVPMIFAICVCLMHFRWYLLFDAWLFCTFDDICYMHGFIHVRWYLFL